MGPIDPPPHERMRPIYVVPGTCPNMKSGCHHQHQIGMDYLWGAIFKMAAIKICGVPQVVHPNLVIVASTSCSDKSQEQNKIGLIMRSWEGGGGCIKSETIY